jgi:Tol biopolymer transport system component
MGTHQMRGSRATAVCGATLLLVIAALALAACGGSDTTTTASSSDTTPPPSASATEPIATPSPTAVSTYRGTIAYESYWPRETADLFVIRTDGKERRELATGDAPLAEAAAWSPDGKRIAYQTSRTVSDEPFIWTMNADGSAKQQVTHGSGGVWPAWSPDGTRLAFISWFYPPTEQPPAKVCVIDADGGRRRLVTRGGANDMQPSWGSDGRIYFLRKPSTVSWDSPDGEVYSVRPDGTGLARVTELEHVGGFGLSPDAQTLAVHDTEQRRILLLSVSGGGSPQTLVATDFGQDLMQPVWSPDGKVIALAHSNLLTPDSWLDETSQIYIVNADGSGLTVVPRAELVISVSWRPE